MKTWSVTCGKVFWGVYLLLTSFYCLLAYLPYTYYAVIKAPPYAWMIWFVRHHALLFWLAFLAAAAASRPRKKSVTHFALLALLAGIGIFLSVKSFLPNLQSDESAYWGSLVALWLLVLGFAAAPFQDAPRKEQEAHGSSPLSYATGILIAVGVALLYVAGAHLRGYSETRSFGIHRSDASLIAWSIITHVLIAILAISILQLIRIAAAKSAHSTTLRRVLLGIFVFAALWIFAVRFLEGALDFPGWRAHLYAASLAAALTLFVFSLLQPFLAGHPSPSAERSGFLKFALAALALGLAFAALALPTLIGGGDWNGILQSSFTLMFWLVLSLCVYSLWPRPAKSSLRLVLGVLLASVLGYKALQATAIFWSAPLGATDDEITRSLESYATQDVSFQLAHRLLSKSHAEPCGELCRILREYTDIRNAQVKSDLQLVGQLVPTQGVRPNIFLFVIDSLRPDYLGAYNPKTNFTPNLDSFAKDSVVLRNVYTPYAGTSLSEPAIWAGALLLHAHFMQPFEKVNSLEKLARTDGYELVVSYDEVLSQILSPSEDLIRLDTDKKLWNQFEICSTLQQTTGFLDNRANSSRPILFYAQPKNVHQFASNNQPTVNTSNWNAPPGFQERVSFEVHQVDECLGSFFADLKSHGLYDNSIIVVTSDHGDATGEFGRRSHSTLLYPEIMRVPLIVHLPENMRHQFVFDDSQVSALIDVTPSLYYLLGHKPIVENPFIGHPLFAETEQELHRYHRDDLFLASDVRAAYGLLADHGRFFYATYDSPAESYLFDLANDPNAQHNIVTSALKKQYDQRVIEHLRAIGDFYGYKPGVGSLLTTTH